MPLRRCGTRGGARGRALRACLAAALLWLGAIPALGQEPVIDPAVRRLMQPELQARITAAGPIRPDQPPEMQPLGGTFSLDTDAAGRIRIALFIELAPGSLPALRALGAEIGAVVGDIAVVRVPLEALAAVSGLPAARIEAARTLRVVHDSSMVAIGADAVRQRAADGWTGATGAGTIVGVVDTGLDLRHPDFHDDAGRTRVLGLWDQTIPGLPPEGFGYGMLCTRDAVQLTADGGAGCPSRDINGHGTHVAGSAAGDGSATGPGGVPFQYAGVAPAADLLIVKAGNASFPEDRVVEGLAWLQREAQARGRPVVANLSLGHQYGPHDGSLLFERAIDNLAGGGFIVVAAAGNEGQNDNTFPLPSGPRRLIHARALPAAGTTATMEFEVSTYTPGVNPCTGNLLALGLWYDGRDRLEITVVRPNGTSVTAGAGTQVVADDPQGRIEISNAVGTAGAAATVEGAIHISGCGTSGVPAPGTWQVRARAGGQVTGVPADLWLHTVVLGPGGVAWGTTGFDNRFIVSAPATSLRTIAVGAFVTRNCWPGGEGGGVRTVCYTVRTETGDLAVFSSAGPSRDGRLKPEVTAPGMGIMSALSRDAGAPAGRVAPDGVHWVLEGTSMAAPHVAGAIALMLQFRPGLSPEDVRQVLARSSRQDEFTMRVYDTSPGARPEDWWGYGKLDVPAALRVLTGGGVIVRLAIIPPVDTIPVGGSLRLRAEVTDDTGGTVFASVDWTSLDPAIATVDAQGTVRGIQAGTARIVAAADAAADTALVRVEPPAVLIVSGRALAPAAPAPSPEGALLPLLALRLEARGPEAIEVESLAFEVTGADAEARLVLLEDPDGSGTIRAGAIAGESGTVALGPDGLVVTVPTDTLVVARNTARHLVLVVRLSGAVPTGATFTARLLPGGVHTVNVNTRIRDNVVMEGAIASGPATTTVLREGELFALSENPIRGDRVILNFAAVPTQAGVFTATGSRVADLGRRIDGVSFTWDLTNDRGIRIVPGVYILVLRIDGRLIRERLFVLSPQLPPR